MSKELEEMISDEEMTKAFANANFGGLTNREVIKQGLLKCAGYWHTGATCRAIMYELKLITQGYKLTKKGGRYLYEALADKRQM